MTRLAAVLSSLAGSVFTANGYRPISKRGYVSGYAFAYGVFASELSLPTAGGHLAFTAAISRWLPPRLRRFTWLVSATSWLGLLGLDRIARRANVPLSAALDDELGPDRRTDSDELWKRPEGAGLAKAPGLIRTMRVYRNYAHDADISYGEYGSRNQLDIWRRPDLDRSGRAPVLLQVPGGAWMIGSKRQQAYPLMSHLAELGWVCVAINYRLSPRSTWPDHIVDVKRALAWTKEHIADFGGDPDWVAITGGSAGGAPVLAGRAHRERSAVSARFRGRRHQRAGGGSVLRHLRLHRHRRIGAPIDGPNARQACVQNQSFGNCGGVSRRLTDHLHIAGGTSLLGAAREQRLSGPVEQARVFTKRLREVSRQPVVYAEMPFAQHAFDIFGSPRAAHAAVAVEQFLAEIYERTTSPVIARAR